MNNSPILIVIPTHAKDAANAETLLRWIAEIGNVSDHSLLIAADSGLPQERVKAMLEIGRKHFYSVRAMIVNVGATGWPLAANLTFRAVARQIYDCYKLDWLWLEPDAVPLRANWLNAIADAYQHSPRPLMGAIINAEKELEGLPARYMSGVAVWPQNTYVRLEALWKDARFTGPVKPSKQSTVQWQNTVRAFDMIAAEYVVPRAQNTPLIHNHWGTAYNEPPVFVPARTEADPPNAVTPSFVRKDAVLFHRVKDVEGFLAMWRVRLEGEKALVVEALKPTGASQYVLEKALEAGLIAPPTELPEPPAPPTPQAMPELAKVGPDNPNFKGGSSPEADKARRQAKAEESRAYLAESRRIAAERRKNAPQQAEPASV